MWNLEKEKKLIRANARKSFIAEIFLFLKLQHRNILVTLTKTHNTLLFA